MEKSKLTNQSESANEASPEVPWTDLPVARVSDMQITGADLLDHIRLTLQQGVLQEALKFKFLEREIARLGIDVTEVDIEEALTEFRVERHLFTAQSTEKWLKERFLSNNDLFDVVQRQVLVKKLRHALIDEEAIAEQFALTRTILTQLSCYQIVVTKESRASELAALIRVGTSFFELARQHSEDETTKHACGYVGIKRVCDFDPEIQSMVSGASQGDIVGPAKYAGQYYLILIEHLYPAKLDDETREIIRADLFHQWCEKHIDLTNMEMLF